MFLNLVSIIVPAFNEEKYISYCIESILNQSYPDIEIIVVNDGSTDNTGKIISEYTNLLIINSTHRGSGFSRNLGAKKARGKILVFIDADMYLDRYYISNLIKPLVLKNKKASVHSTEYILNINNIWSYCWNINNNIWNNIRIDLSINNSYVFRAIKKRIFFRLKSFNPNKGYYDDFNSRIKRTDIIHIKDAIAYHFNPDSFIDVFYQARWIGRSPNINISLYNLLRYSIINSIFNSIKKILKGAPIFFIIFKIIFDFGIICGMITKNKVINYAR